MDIIIGRRIRRARMQTKISMETLAEKIDTRHNAIAKYERGEVSITVKRLAQIASTLHKPFVYFLPAKLQGKKHERRRHEDQGNSDQSTAD